MRFSTTSLLLVAATLSGISTSVAGDLHPHGQPHGMQRRAASQPGATVPNLAYMANRKRGLMYELDERDAEADWQSDLVERDATEHYLEFVERDLAILKRAIMERAPPDGTLMNGMTACSQTQQACINRITATGPARNGPARICNDQYLECLKKLVDDRSRKFRLAAKGKTCFSCKEDLKVLETTYKSGCGNGHYSHPDCMKGWVTGIRNWCPDCRQDMRKREEV